MGVRRTTKSSRTSPAMIALAERRAKTLELRRQAAASKRSLRVLASATALRIGTYASAWRRSWPSRWSNC
jgi:hypothetical protein